MADSTSNLDTISSSQEDKEETANEIFDALSPPSLYGRRASTTTGLTWGFYGGRARLTNGSLTTITNSIVTLTASAVNYIEASPTTGLLTKVTSQFTAGKVPLYSIAALVSTVNTYADHRVMRQPDARRRAISMSDANYTLTQDEAACSILEFLGTLTTSRAITFPDDIAQYTVCNSTGQLLELKTAAGSGALIANTKRAVIYSDGTHIQRVTPDT
jgi:hypothetical protein